MMLMVTLGGVEPTTPEMRGTKPSELLLTMMVIRSLSDILMILKPIPTGDYSFDMVKPLTRSSPATMIFIPVIY